MGSHADNDAARRAYWIEQMEAAAGFMEDMKVRPVAECGEPLASLKAAVAAAAVEVAFSATRLAGRFDRLFHLREGVVGPFLAAAHDMNKRGWVLKVEDAFRTRDMQKHLALAPRMFDTILDRVIWELDGKVPPVELMLRRLTALVATCPKIGTHMSGSAIDVSVLSRENGEELDRGAPYLELSELTPMDSPFPNARARRQRQEMTAILARHGFAAYPYEFWHYSQGDAYAMRLFGTDGVAKYGPVDLDPASGRVTPIEEPAALLSSLDEIQEQIEAALARRSQRS